jgi:hypothetical protein
MKWLTNYEGVIFIPENEDDVEFLKELKNRCEIPERSFLHGLIYFDRMGNLRISR